MYSLCTFTIGQQAGEELEDEAASPLLDLGDMKVGKKKLAKLEAKAEKKAAREAEEKEREERKTVEFEREKERRRQQEQEDQLEKDKEDQAKREAEEKIRREHEEYLKMKVLLFLEIVLVSCSALEMKSMSNIAHVGYLQLWYTILFIYSFFPGCFYSGRARV